MDLERVDTLPLFTDSDEFGLFEEIIQDSSFHERLDSKDIREILSSSEEQSDDSSSLQLWNNLDRDTLLEDVRIESSYKPPKVITAKKMVQVGDAIYLLKNETNDDFVATKEEFDLDVVTPVLDSSSSSSASLGVPSLSLQPWKGKFDFSIKVEIGTHSNSKWAFSNILKKLFLKPFDSVPIEVKITPWLAGCYVNITPVYTSSQYTSFPVNRCHNHKNLDQEKKLPYFEHIVQVDNCDAKYREDGSRHSVDIPLGVPAPGEVTKLLYVKCGCWNTCTGGPSRKPFCLVFTLFDSIGQEIGRQILDLKVCACPVRDCGYSEKKFSAKKQTSGKNIKKVKPPASKKIGYTCKGSKRVKTEPTEQNVEYVPVPVEISTEVKQFINRIMAEKFAKENNFCPPFPDV